MTKRDEIELILLRYRDNYYTGEKGAIDAIEELFK